MLNLNEMQPTIAAKFLWENLFIKKNYAIKTKSKWANKILQYYVHTLRIEKCTNE